MKQLLASILVVFWAWAGAVHAGQELTTTLRPVVAGAIGPAHPEGSDYMRANHMKLLIHDRDLTVHLGDRDIPYSLKQCVTCHATRGPDAMPIPINAETQFCAACHDYAAVKIDCFECHSTKPDIDTARLLLGKYPEDAELKELVDYLDGMTE